MFIFIDISLLHLLYVIVVVMNTTPVPNTNPTHMDDIEPELDDILMII